MQNNIINIDPEIMSGTPVFCGTRVPIQSLFDWLETETLNEFLENFPTVSKPQALEVLRLAEKLITSPDILNENFIGRKSTDKVETTI
ncbi:MAG: DUF433 domain-containing protein [Aridibacter sp.]|jgi:uncharacterized protein (DUF433 family)|nr:DUF433 domain-containing protein [Acidobacteriota bacterium]